MGLRLDDRQLYEFRDAGHRLSREQLRRVPPSGWRDRSSEPGRFFRVHHPDRYRVAGGGHDLLHLQEFAGLVS